MFVSRVEKGMTYDMTKSYLEKSYFDKACLVTQSLYLHCVNFPEVSFAAIVEAPA